MVEIGENSRVGIYRVGNSIILKMSSNEDSGVFLYSVSKENSFVRAATRRGTTKLERESDRLYIRHVTGRNKSFGTSGRDGT